MRILGIIPVRGGSKGIPKKNIKMLCGKPLLQYTIDAANNATKLTKVILSSDDEAIMAIAKDFDIEVPFTRPHDLAQDDTPTLAVIQHALRFYMARGIHFDAVCLLQVTSPFKTGAFIDAAIQKFITSDCDALISVQEIPEEYNPHWAFKENETGNLELFTGASQIIARRQDLPKTYHRDGLIYITKTQVLLKKNSLYGSKLAYIKSPGTYTINIDTMADWEQAEAFLNSNNT
jgi:N-acylneuraminate cytidylyltransferase